MSAQIDPTELKTTDLDLANAFLALLTEFLKSEVAPLRAFTDAATQHFTGDEATLKATLIDMAEVVDIVADALMAGRLATNNRKVPLLHPSDSDRIVTSMFDGVPMSGELAATMAILKPIASLNIGGNIALLSAIDADMYSAFWKFAAALMNEVASSGRTLKQVVVSPASRAAVYQTCMTYQTWRKLTAARCALQGGISISSLFGEAGNLLPDDEQMALYREQIVTSDAKGNAERVATVKRFKKFYTDLGQTIWPAGNRH